MNPRRTSGARAGFTVVELMVGLISAAVLALVMGAVLYASTSSYATSMDTVRGHHDVSVAVRALRNALRHATADAVDVDGNTVSIVGPGGNVQVFTYDPQSGSLLLDPGTGGDTVVLVADVVTTFGVTINGNAAVLQLGVSGRETDMDVSSTVAFRNGS